MTDEAFKPAFDLPKLKVRDAGDADRGPGGLEALAAMPAVSATGCIQALGASAGAPPVDPASFNSALLTVLHRQIGVLRQSSKRLRSLHLFPIAYALSSVLPVAMFFIFLIGPRVSLPDAIVAPIHQQFELWFFNFMLSVDIGAFFGIEPVKLYMLTIILLPALAGMATAVSLQLVKGMTAVHKTIAWFLIVSVFLIFLIEQLRRFSPMS